MTEKQLKELGFDIDKNSRVYHIGTEISFKINNLRLTTPAHFINVFYSHVMTEGKEAGKIDKIIEIKEVLGLSTEI